MKISALILTKNEEEMIEDCLKQLDFVDEIIVLDQFSSDETADIAQKYTNKVLKTNNIDFDKNRMLLASEAKGEWLLYVDSDERISTDLRKEILEAVENNKISAYFIPRKNYILGKIRLSSIFSPSREFICILASSGLWGIFCSVSQFLNS